MNSAFYLKWLLSLFVGGAWVTLSTMVAEKVNPKLGGLIAGVPSAAVITLLFIALTQSPEKAVAATTVIPMSTGFYCLFFIAYLLATRKGFVKGLSIALLVWLLFSVLAVKLNVQSITTSLMTWVLFVSASIWYASTQIKLKEVGQIKIKYTLAQLLGRALFSGVIISFGVIMSKLAGPVWGVVMSTFPALTIASFLITIRTGGLEFTRHLARNILISNEAMVKAGNV